LWGAVRCTRWAAVRIAKFASDSSDFLAVLIDSNNCRNDGEHWIKSSCLISKHDSPRHKDVVVDERPTIMPHLSWQFLRWALEARY
jgi:hypothetical protein